MFPADEEIQYVDLTFASTDEYAMLKDNSCPSFVLSTNCRCCFVNEKFGECTEDAHQIQVDSKSVVRHCLPYPDPFRIKVTRSLLTLHQNYNVCQAPDMLVYWTSKRAFLRSTGDHGGEGGFGEDAVGAAVAAFAASRTATALSVDRVLGRVQKRKAGPVALKSRSPRRREQASGQVNRARTA